MTLTLDSTIIQAYAGAGHRDRDQAYDVRNGGFCVVMDPRPGLSWPARSRSSTQQLLRRDGSLLQGGDPGGRPGFYEQLKAGERPEARGEAEYRRGASGRGRRPGGREGARTPVAEQGHPGSRTSRAPTFKALVLAAALEGGRGG